MAHRSKCNLIAPPSKEVVTIEPVKGPGSATCFCRVMDRKMKRIEAREALQSNSEKKACNASTSIYQVRDASDLSILSSELLEASAKGYKLEVLVLIESGNVWRPPA